MRLLIGYDGSECAEAAIDDLKRSGLPQSGEALIVSVAEEWPAYTLAGFDALEREDPAFRQAPGELTENAPASDRWSRTAAATASRGAERMRVILPGWEIGTSVYRSSPYSALLQVADEWKPDMLLVGSHGRSAVGRAVFGSVSHFIVNHAHCSVRVARSPLFVSNAPERLIIALDGSEDSLNAVEEVAKRNWPKGTEARVVTALDHRFLSLVPNYDYPVAQYCDTLDADMRKQVEVAAARASSRLALAGIHTQYCLREGDPRYLLVEEADQWQADCVFLGAKGHSALERFLVGRVSASVALQAHCSVEIVRPRSSV